MSPGKEFFNALQLADALQVPESRVQGRHSFEAASAQLLHLRTPVETHMDGRIILPVPAWS